LQDIARFALLGIGTGGIYALLAIGIVLIYRGSGVVNFANGGFALVGAACYFDFRDELGALGAIVVGVAACAFLGALVQLIIMRPMRRSSALARVIATLGVLVVFQELARRRYGEEVQFVQGFLPDRALNPFGNVFVGEDRVLIFGLAIVLVAGLTVVYRRTRFGLATTGVAENEFATSTLGWSPPRVATINWAAGAALAGLAGALLVPITGFAPTTFTLTIVPALAAALVGGFASFPLTLFGGVLIGVLEAEALLFQSQHSDVLGVSTTGLASSVPFLAIILLLVVRGRALPLRSHLTDRLPGLGTGKPRWGSIAIFTALFAGATAVFTNDWLAAMTTSAIFGLLSLSVVVVTGYAGQLSLAQFALAGVGALFASRMADAWGMPFPLALIGGLLLTVPVGLIVALPAIRARGVNLAVATLGLAVVISSAVLSNPRYTGGPIRGTVLPEPKIFGWSVESLAHPDRYALVALVAFVLAGLMLSNVRRGATGRRLIAVRDNERAAASLGVSVVGAKLYAFGLGSVFAAFAGILLAFRNSVVDFNQFAVFGSIQAVLQAVIGGVGYIAGAIVGGMGSPGALGQQLMSEFWDTTGLWILISAVLLLVVVVRHQDGIASDLCERFSRLLLKISRLFVRRPDQSGRAEAERMAVERVETTVHRLPPRRLEVRGLTVRFGGVVAVDDLSFEIQPGEVVGLIGPNGAGKTTVIDAVTGFLNNYGGKVLVDGRSIDGLTPRKRVRAGITRSFQSLELFEDLTVFDNLRTACEERSVATYFTDLIWPARRPLSSAAAASIEEFRLGPVLDQRPPELPYAQRRAVAIARAVAVSPSVLLLDEPAAGLDDASTRELAVLIRRLATQWGMAVLLIEHDVSMVLSTADRVVAVNFGRAMATGTPDHIRNHPEVIASYLGEPTDVENPLPTTTLADSP
jgi:ABC-type branched-subunit amino acid transport system ATPase component/branched-subunit amino acid ABC-type transport system permease component